MAHTTAHSAEAGDPPVRCPRCGYDQSGMTDWTDRCPLTGRCSECGYDYEWASLFAPIRHDLAGFVEHARTRRDRFVWSWVTLSWALLPNRFWSRVTVNQRVDLRGMLLWPLLLLAIPYAIWGLSGMGRHYAMVEIFGRGWGMTHGPIGYLTTWTAPFYQAVWFGGQYLGTFNPDPLLGIMPVLAMHAGYLLMMVLFIDSRRLAALRAVHPLRAFVYGLTAFAPLLAVLLRYQVIAMSIELTRTRTARAAALVSMGIPTLRILWATYAVFLVIWIPWWWALAMIRVWRLSQGVLVWALLTIVALLAGATSFIVVSN